MFVAVAVSISMLAILAKSIVTFVHHNTIYNAIDRYQKHCRRHGKEINVNFDDMENFYITFIKFWNWDLKHILSKKQFRLVKDFIGSGVNT